MDRRKRGNTHKRGFFCHRSRRHNNGAAVVYSRVRVREGQTRRCGRCNSRYFLLFYLPRWHLPLWFRAPRGCRCNFHRIYLWCRLRVAFSQLRRQSLGWCIFDFVCRWGFGRVGDPAGAGQKPSIDFRSARDASCGQLAILVDCVQVRAVRTTNDEIAVALPVNIFADDIAAVVKSCHHLAM